ncbi:MAG: hypothetical protein ABIE23_02090 [archaeon]
MDKKIRLGIIFAVVLVVGVVIVMAFTNGSGAEGAATDYLQQEQKSKECTKTCDELVTPTPDCPDWVQCHSTCMEGKNC